MLLASHSVSQTHKHTSSNARTFWFYHFFSEIWKQKSFEKNDGDEMKKNNNQNDDAEDIKNTVHTKRSYRQRPRRFILCRPKCWMLPTLFFVVIVCCWAAVSSVQCFSVLIWNLLLAEFMHSIWFVCMSVCVLCACCFPLFHLFMLRLLDKNLVVTYKLSNEHTNISTRVSVQVCEC